MCRMNSSRTLLAPLESASPPPAAGGSPEGPTHGTVYETAVGGKKFWMQYIKPEESYEWDLGDWYAGLFVSPTPVSLATPADVCAYWQELQRDGYLVHVWWTSVAAHQKAGTLRPIAICEPAPQALQLYGKCVRIETGEDGTVVGWKLCNYKTGEEIEVKELTPEQKLRYPRKDYWFVPEIRAALASGYRPELDGPEIGSKPFQIPPDMLVSAKEEYERIDEPYELVAVYGNAFGPDEVTCTEYLYFTAEHDALAFVQAVRKPDWYVRVERRGERTWSVKITFRFDLESQSVFDLEPIEEELERIADQHNGEYDGHEIGPLP